MHLKLKSTGLFLPRSRQRSVNKKKNTKEFLFVLSDNADTKVEN